MAAIYAVYTSPTHPPIPNHLPTLIVTPHGQPQNILYSYLHTNFNTENYLLTPSPQGDLCVAKLFPPRPSNQNPTKASASDPGHSSSSHASSSSPRVVRCEASRNLKWSITNTGVISPIYKLSLPSPDSPDLPLFQVSKPNPNAGFWSMFYFAYAGHNIPPKRIEFGKIQKNPPGPNGGGTRISITGKTPEEKAVWQTLGEGNEDCVEWVVLCAALNLLDDEILKAAEKNPPVPSPSVSSPALGGRPPAPVSLRDPGARPPQGHAPNNQQLPPPQQRGPPGAPPQMNGYHVPPPGPGMRGPPLGQGPPPPGYGRGYPPNGAPGPGMGGFPPQGYAPGPPGSQRPGLVGPQMSMPNPATASMPGMGMPPHGYPRAPQPQQIPQQVQGQPRRF